MLLLVPVARFFAVNGLQFLHELICGNHRLIFSVLLQIRSGKLRAGLGIDLPKSGILRNVETGNFASSFSSAVRSQTGDLNAYVIALNDADACVILDASGTSDPDHLPLQFSWIIDGTNTVPGMVVTNCFDLGCHSVVLEVNNGRLTSRCPTNVCAISGSEAVEQCIALVDGASIDRKNLRPLIATLKAVSAAMDRGDLIPAMNGLEAFRNKVAAQIAPANPTEAASFITAIQHILDAINCAAVVGTAAGQQ